MAFSMSLHIGVNQVDPATYGAVPALRSAVKDAEAMEAIAADLEYQDRLILRNGDATVSAVLARLGVMAQQVEPGGVVMVTFAGHGSEVPDDTGDEPSGRDQTWVLYDRMLIDDQLRAMWGRFAPGVRIFFVSDSCHSGSVARDFKAILAHLKLNKRQFLVGARDILGADVPMERQLPPEAALKVFEKYESEIVSTQWTCGSRGLDDIRATVISLTACQDDEVAGDLTNHGVFTGKLLEVWDNGRFSGSSEQLLQAVASKIGMYQRPQYKFFGAANSGMLAQKPFTVAVPTVRGIEDPLDRRPWMETDRCKPGGRPEVWAGVRRLRDDGPFIGPDWARREELYSRGIESGHAELTTFERPSFRCVLELNEAASKSLTPEIFEGSVKKELADMLSAAFSQAHTGLIARGILPPGVTPRVHGSAGGSASCESKGGRTECKGEIHGEIRF